MREFLVMNISNRDVSLSDLNLTIRAKRTVNLLDNRHYNFTLEQLQLSLKSGSLFKKSNILKVIPNKIKNPKLLEIPKKTTFPDKHRTTVVVNYYEYKEEDFEDDLKVAEHIAEENAKLEG